MIPMRMAGDNELMNDKVNSVDIKVYSIKGGTEKIMFLNGEEIHIAGDGKLNPSLDPTARRMKGEIFEICEAYNSTKTEGHAMHHIYDLIDALKVYNLYCIDANIDDSFELNLGDKMYSYGITINTNTDFSDLKDGFSEIHIDEEIKKRLESTKKTLEKATEKMIVDDNDTNTRWFLTCLRAYEALCIDYGISDQIVIRTGKKDNLTIRLHPAADLDNESCPDVDSTDSSSHNDKDYWSRENIDSTAKYMRDKIFHLGEIYSNIPSNYKTNKTYFNETIVGGYIQRSISMSIKEYSEYCEAHHIPDTVEMDVSSNDCVCNYRMIISEKYTELNEDDYKDDYVPYKGLEPEVIEYLYSLKHLLTDTTLTLVSPKECDDPEKVVEEAYDNTASLINLISSYINFCVEHHIADSIKLPLSNKSILYVTIMIMGTDETKHNNDHIEPPKNKTLNDGVVQDYNGSSNNIRQIILEEAGFPLNVNVDWSPDEEIHIQDVSDIRMRSLWELRNLMDWVTLQLQTNYYESSNLVGKFLKGMISLAKYSRAKYLLSNTEIDSAIKAYYNDQIMVAIHNYETYCSHHHISDTVILPAPLAEVHINGSSQYIDYYTLTIKDGHILYDEDWKEVSQWESRNKIAMDDVDVIKLKHREMSELEYIIIELAPNAWKEFTHIVFGDNFNDDDYYEHLKHRQLNDSDLIKASLLVKNTERSKKQHIWYLEAAITEFRLRCIINGEDHVVNVLFSSNFVLHMQVKSGYIIYSLMDTKGTTHFEKGEHIFSTWDKIFSNGSIRALFGLHVIYGDNVSDRAYNYNSPMIKQKESVKDYLKKSIYVNTKLYESSMYTTSNNKEMTAFYFTRVLKALDNYIEYCGKCEPHSSDVVIVNVWLHRKPISKLSEQSSINSCCGGWIVSIYLHIKDGVIERDDGYILFNEAKNQTLKHYGDKSSSYIRNCIMTNHRAKMVEYGSSAYGELLSLICFTEEVTVSSILEAVNNAPHSAKKDIKKFNNALLDLRLEAILFNEQFSIGIMCDYNYRFLMTADKNEITYEIWDSNSGIYHVCAAENIMDTRNQIMQGSSDALYGRTLFSRWFT